CRYISGVLTDTRVQCSIINVLSMCQLATSAAISAKADSPIRPSLAWHASAAEEWALTRRPAAIETTGLRPAEPNPGDWQGRATLRLRSPRIRRPPTVATAASQRAWAVVPSPGRVGPSAYRSFTSRGRILHQRFLAYKLLPKQVCS